MAPPSNPAQSARLARVLQSDGVPAGGFRVSMAGGGPSREGGLRACLLCLAQYAQNLFYAASSLHDSRSGRSRQEFLVLNAGETNCHSVWLKRDAQRPSPGPGMGVAHHASTKRSDS